MSTAPGSGHERAQDAEFERELQELVDRSERRHNRWLNGMPFLSLAFAAAGFAGATIVSAAGSRLPEFVEFLCLAVGVRLPGIGIFVAILPVLATRLTFGRGAADVRRGPRWLIPASVAAALLNLVALIVLWNT